MLLTKGWPFTFQQRNRLSPLLELPCAPDTFSYGTLPLGGSTVSQQQKARYLLRFLSTTESVNISAS
jgi:hypothetical protein